MSLTQEGHRSFTNERMSRRVRRPQQIIDQKNISPSRNEESSSLVPPTTDRTLPPQDILKVFQESFSDILSSPELQTMIQTVKHDLYNRDYIKAFSDNDRRVAYCARWSPSRALCYASLFSSLEEIQKLLSQDTTKILCIGGGAGSELTALCSLFTKSRVDGKTLGSQMKLTLVDIANWSSVLERLKAQIKSSWIKHSQNDIKVDFVHGDALKLSAEQLGLSSLDLVTLLFTTNELFTEQRVLSVNFLQSLEMCQSGCYLLIAESAGSYSHITIGSKKFPVQFLIDTILLGKEQNGHWELVKESDSCWYRCPNDLRYNLKLENMRFFYRLYRKK